MNEDGYGSDVSLSDRPRPPKDASSEGGSDHDGSESEQEDRSVRSNSYSDDGNQHQAPIPVAGPHSDDDEEETQRKSVFRHAGSVRKPDGLDPADAPSDDIELRKRLQNMQQAMTALDEWKGNADNLLDPYNQDSAFRGLEVTDGSTPDSKELWAIWDGHLRHLRNRETMKFVKEKHYAEDLLWGQQLDIHRVWSEGFQRSQDDKSVLWKYFIRNGGGTSSDQPGANDTVHILKRDTEILGILKGGNYHDVFEALRHVKFEPHRVGEKGTTRESRRKMVKLQGDKSGTTRKVIDPLGTGLSMEDTNNLGYYQLEKNGVDLQKNKKWQLDENGQRVLGQDGEPVLVDRDQKVAPSTFGIRLQIISIRLNAHHWEWQYSRYLKNHSMYDTPSMTPYLHNTEFGDGNKDLHASPTAIPLLTRGTLNFRGVRLGASDGGPKPPKVAIETLEDLKGNWTVLRMRGLPRILASTLVPSDRVKELTAEMKTIMRTAARRQTNCVMLNQENPPVEVACLFLNMQTPMQPCWATVFAIDIDPYLDIDDTERYEFYANAYTADEEDLVRLLKVRGYDSWVGGSGAAAIMASTNVEKANERLEMEFTGLPIFFSGIDKGNGADVPVDNTGNPKPGPSVGQCGPFFDARTHVGAGTKKRAEGTAETKFYSEVYRELMFAPLPVRGVETLPVAHVFNTSEPKTFRASSDVQDQKASGAVRALQRPKYLNLTSSLSDSRADHTHQSVSGHRSGGGGAGDGPDQSHPGGENTGTHKLHGLPGTDDDDVWEMRQHLKQHYPEVLMINRKLDSEVKQARKDARPEAASLAKQKNLRKAKKAKAKQPPKDADPEGPEVQGAAASKEDAGTIKQAMQIYVKNYERSLVYFKGGVVPLPLQPQNGKSGEIKSRIESSQLQNPCRQPVGSTTRVASTLARDPCRVDSTRYCPWTSILRCTTLQMSISRVAYTTTSTRRPWDAQTRGLMATIQTLQTAPARPTGGVWSRR